MNLITDIKLFTTLEHHRLIFLNKYISFFISCDSNYKYQFKKLIIINHFQKLNDCKCLILFQVVFLVLKDFLIIPNIINFLSIHLSICFQTKCINMLKKANSFYTKLDFFRFSSYLFLIILIYTFVKNPRYLLLIFFFLLAWTMPINHLLKYEK